ncbi:uncharacterized protein LOC143355275 [Halictus rubicundus]|uniref:uncharacterized protein LOC143355275 n=1 Tax=Halictus rubicundus TaxID=77578 RepID=UPI004035A440
MVDLSDGPFEYSVNNVVFVVPGIVVVGLAGHVTYVVRCDSWLSEHVGRGHVGPTRCNTSQSDKNWSSSRPIGGPVSARRLSSRETRVIFPVIDHLPREWNVFDVCIVSIVFQRLFLIDQVAASDAPGAPVEDNAAPNAVPDFDKQLPTPEQLLEMLDSMTGLSEEEKNSIRQDLLGNLRGDSPQSLGGNDMTTQTVILLSLLGVVALIFVFFVYKLFKCLSEREAKREEKKKQKQLKKKK